MICKTSEKLSLKGEGRSVSCPCPSPVPAGQNLDITYHSISHLRPCPGDGRTKSKPPQQLDSWNQKITRPASTPAPLKTSPHQQPNWSFFKKKKNHVISKSWKPFSLLPNAPWIKHKALSTGSYDLTSDLLCPHSPDSAHCRTQPSPVPFPSLMPDFAAYTFEAGLRAYSFLRWTLSLAAFLTESNTTTDMVTWDFTEMQRDWGAFRYRKYSFRAQEDYILLELPL